MALYWFAVGFAFLFTVSAIMGLTLGAGLREALGVAFWHALVASLVLTALGAATVFGLALSGVPL